MYLLYVQLWTSVSLLYSLVVFVLYILQGMVNASRTLLFLLVVGVLEHTEVVEPFAVPESLYLGCPVTVLRSSGEWQDGFRVIEMDDEEILVRDAERDVEKWILKEHASEDIRRPSRRTPLMQWFIDAQVGVYRCNGLSHERDSLSTLKASPLFSLQTIGGKVLAQMFLDSSGYTLDALRLSRWWGSLLEKALFEDKNWKLHWVQSFLGSSVRLRGFTGSLPDALSALDERGVAQRSLAANPRAMRWAAQDFAREVLDFFL